MTAERVDILLIRQAAPSLRIRSLHREQDFAFATQVFEKAADYVELERGMRPSAETVKEFFEGCPPTMTLHDKLVLGILDDQGNGLGVIDLLRGYPEPGDWYIGLLMLDPAARASGVGKRALDWVVEFARENGVRRLLVCALEENSRGRAFWAREGFVHLRTIPPTTLGTRTHTRFEIVRTLR